MRSAEAVWLNKHQCAQGDWHEATLWYGAVETERSAASLLRCRPPILQDPQQRISLQAVQQHPWFLTNLPPDCQVRGWGAAGWGEL